MVNVYTYFYQSLKSFSDSIITVNYIKGGFNLLLKTSFEEAKTAYKSATVQINLSLCFYSKQICKDWEWKSARFQLSTSWLKEKSLLFLKSGLSIYW